MTGRRVQFIPGFPGNWSLPGDYCRVPDEIDLRGPGIWYAVDPLGSAVALVPRVHRVAEHEDGTISVSPSIVVKGSGYHGFLTRGEWS